MTSNQTRYPPLPGRYDTWQAWANNYIAFNSGGTQIKQPMEPTAILLSHRIGDGNIGDERAFTDGLLMFDPSIGKVVVSVNGVWVPLATA